MSRFSLLLLFVVIGSAFAVENGAPNSGGVDSIVQRQLLPAYQDGDRLLLDGMKTHVWSLAQDPLLAEELKSQQLSSRTLAFLRRLAILRGFMRAIQTRLESQFSLSAKQQMQARREGVLSVQTPLVKKVQDALASDAKRLRSGKSQVRDLIQQCQHLCAGF